MKNRDIIYASRQLCMYVLRMTGHTRDDPKVLIFTLLLCSETFLRGILCNIRKNKFLPI